MRGQLERSDSLFSYVSIEERIPASHPLRRIRRLADQALDRLNPTFCELYAAEGRPSVPPEQLLLASLLQAFYGIRSERLLLEQIRYYNLLFRWFLGLSPDAVAFPQTPRADLVYNGLIWRRGNGHIANRSAQPAAAGWLSIDPHGDAGGEARHHGAAGDGHAQATAQPLLRL